MKRVPLGPNGPEISEVVFGTWRFREDAEGFSPARLRAKIDACLEAGITTLDMADIYGGYSCHEAHGKVFREDPSLRSHLEIITKCGILAPCGEYSDIPVKHYRATIDHIVSSAEKALSQLSMDVLDVLLVHRPDCLTRADETAEAFDRLIREGKIRHGGVSNYTRDQFSLLQGAMKHPLATNQIELSLFTLDAMDNGVLAQCEAEGVRPMAWSPLGGGRLFDPSDATASRLRSLMEELSPKYDGASPDQLACAWILALPARPVVVLGTNRVERIPIGARCAEIELEREDWFRLLEAARGCEVP